MMFVLNRLRGTQGLWSKIIGLFLALVVQIAFGNPYVSIAVGLGYIIGESFGWGLWVGSLAVHREATPNKTEDEGANNGIQWIARKIVPNYLENWLMYCRVAMFFRGLYWYAPTLLPLYFLGFNLYLLLDCILFLSIGFPLAYDLGYYLRDKVSFNKYGLSIQGGWELGEVIVGIEQDLVILTLIGAKYYVMA